MLDIKFNYDFDTEGFFSGEVGTTRRETLEEAASFYEKYINDNLLAINPNNSNFWTAYFLDPATGELDSIFNPEIPENTIVIYVGGRDLDALARGGPGTLTVNGTPDFQDLVKGRGQTGALANLETDVSIWGGSLTFDTNIVINGNNYDWHNSKNLAGLDSEEIDFLSIALHEIAHVLGIGTLPAWENQISDNSFLGTNALEIYQQETNPNAIAVPLHPNGEDDHWPLDVTSFDSSGARHSPILRPRGEFGTRNVVTNLDYAALQDIGWEIELDSSPIVTNPIDDLTFLENQDSYTLDLNNIFSDPDNDEITFSVEDNSNTALVSAVINENDLNLQFLDHEFGTANITVRATANGLSVDDSFSITIQEQELNTAIYRFHNSSIPGTYLFAAESERANITANFPNFIDEGLAFKVAIEPGDNLIPFYRLQSKVTPGTYLFAAESERANITDNFANSFTDEGLAFYVYGAGSDLGTDFSRFQNSDRPGTYLFATGEERDHIRANFTKFVEEGIAFEVKI